MPWLSRSRDVVGGDVERAPREPQPAHAVREPRGAEADLRDLEPVADVHQPVLVGDLEPVELELAVPAVLLRAHDRNAPHDAPAGLVAVEHERGEALARIVGGLREQDEMLRDAGAGDEPLAAVDDPLVAFAASRSSASSSGRSRRPARARS